MLAFEGKNPGETFREYIPAGEKLESWTRFASVRQYPDQDDPMKLAKNMAQLLAKQNPEFRNAIVRNPKTGDVMIDFIMWPENNKFVEFNVFIFRKKEAGGVAAQQYAVRAYDKQADFMKDLKSLRDKLCPLMGKDGLTLHEAAKGDSGRSGETTGR